jgi:hypothetical protein
VQSGEILCVSVCARSRVESTFRRVQHRTDARHARAIGSYAARQYGAMHAALPVQLFFVNTFAAAILLALPHAHMYDPAACRAFNLCLSISTGWYVCSGRIYMLGVYIRGLPILLTGNKRCYFTVNLQCIRERTLLASVVAACGLHHY